MVVKFHRQRRALQLAYLYIDHLLDLYLDAGGLDEDQLGKLGQQIHQQLLKYKQKNSFGKKLKLKFFERLLFNTCVRRTYGQTCTDALIQTHLYRRTCTNKLIRTHLTGFNYTDALKRAQLNACT